MQPIERLERAANELIRRHDSMRHVCVLLSVSVVMLVTALAVVAHRYRPVIVVTPECGQTAYNNGENYRQRIRRYVWRYV